MNEQYAAIVSLVQKPNRLAELGVADRVKLYRLLRRLKEEMEDAHKKRMQPLGESMARLEGLMLAKMIEDQTESYKTPYGTVYKSLIRRIKVLDWGAFLQWAQENDELGMVTRSVAKRELDAYLANHDGELPPGITVEQIINVNFKA